MAIPIRLRGALCALSMACAAQASAGPTLYGTVYAAPPGASVEGELKLPDRLVPYVGIGWSRRTSLAQGFVFRGEIGAMYQAPKVTLAATGIPGLTQADIDAERRKLQDEAGKYRWYPVVSISVGYGF